MLAAQLLRRGDPACSVVVVEKTSSVGRGLAYGTECPSLLLNVRTRNMSAFADDPTHFLRWAQSNHDPATGPGSFLPRAVYGRYIQAVLDEAVHTGGEQRLQWVKDEALRVSPTGDGTLNVALESGRVVRADAVVLALGNCPPGDPFAAWDAKAGTRYFLNPWSHSTFKDVENSGDILLVGSGLTSVDVAVELRLRGCRGIIHISVAPRIITTTSQGHGRLSALLEQVFSQNYSRTFKPGAAASSPSQGARDRMAERIRQSAAAGCANLAIALRARATTLSATCASVLGSPPPSHRAANRPVDRRGDFPPPDSGARRQDHGL